MDSDEIRRLLVDRDRLKTLEESSSYLLGVNRAVIDTLTKVSLLLENIRVAVQDAQRKIQDLEDV